MHTRPYSPLLYATAWAVMFLMLAGAVTLTGCKRARGVETEGAPEPAMTIAEPHVQAASLVDAGRYIVSIAGCNDCHTPGYMEAGGNLPESEWLTGLPIGFQGPWGTSYPANLRLTVQDLTEDAFVQMARTREGLPPMPWFSLHDMQEQDLRAVYQYIRSLGPKGERAPVAVPPGEEPATPYFVFVPQHMERLQAMMPADTTAAAVPADSTAQ